MTVAEQMPVSKRGRDFQERVRKARETGTYEMYRRRLVHWVQHDRLMHWEIGMKMGIPESQVKYMCHVLEITAERHNRYSHRQLMNERIVAWNVQHMAEMKVVQAIRAYVPTGQDRGW
jgi:flagellar motor component MotA